ncbi:MAG: putative RNA-binding protein [halophilic archaeon J07HX64]|jgi:Predicted RNA-binding protein|nr:MAG: putative RNA-binding protein [halophilic archaeon J07HX64]
MSEDNTDQTADAETAIVLDVLPHGRTEDDRPQYEKKPLAFVLDKTDFSLYELTLEEATLSIGDRLDIYDSPQVGRTTGIDHEDLPRGAASELEYVVEDLVAAEEQRFVDFYNEAQPITLRLHQLNLLPGIGKKLRNDILDARKRRPFESFEDIEARIDGLHNPREVLADRIMEELREDDLKYCIFAREE